MSESMIAEAMQAVFGPEPSDAYEKVGYNIAMMHLRKTVEEAEPVLQGLQPHSYMLESILRIGFRLASNGDLEYVSEPGKQIITGIVERLTQRYEGLVPKAA